MFVETVGVGVQAVFGCVIQGVAAATGEKNDPCRTGKDGPSNGRVAKPARFPEMVTQGQAAAGLGQDA